MPTLDGEALHMYMNADGASEVRYLRAPRVFTAAGTDVINDGIVKIMVSKIESVGPADSFEQEIEGKHVEHFHDATILPGLVDAHAHITLAGDRRTYEEMAVDSDEMMALVSVMNLQRHLSCGVTTLRDNGGRNRITFIVREAIERGYINGPRLLLSGRPITHSRGHFYWCNGVADGDVAIRSAVRTLVAEGADHIKIMASGGSTSGNLVHLPSYNVEELRVAVETAHQLDRLTTAHCRSTSSMVNALEAGLDCIEHATFLVPGESVEYRYGHQRIAAKSVMKYDQAVTERMLNSGVFVSYTLQAGGYDTLVELRDKSTDGTLAPEEKEQKSVLEEYYDTKLDIFSRLMQDGMMPHLVISTDAGPGHCEFGRMYYGLELAVRAGMAPAQALLATTRLAAEACGVQDLVGSIEPGKEADLVVVDGDPLDSIGAMRDVRAVYKGGNRVGPVSRLGIPGALPIT